MQTIIIKNDRANSQLFEDMSFLLKAYNPSVNPFFCPNSNIIAENNNLFISDGFRIHSVVLDIPNGQYVPVTQNKKLIVLQEAEIKDTSFLTRYLKNLRSLTPISTCELSLKSTCSVQKAIEYANLIRHIDDENTISYDYFTDLIHSDGVYHAKIMSDRVLFENCTKKAIIHLIRCDLN